MIQTEIFSLIGVGLRSKYYQDIIDQYPNTIGWFEVHPENYFGGGRRLSVLEKVRANYPLSLHAVGLSLGSDQPLDRKHLEQLKELARRFEPFLISDHASWSASGNAHLNDLLPLPLTQNVLKRLADNVSYTQDFLGCQILIENPSSYISFEIDEMSEPTFLNQLVHQTGCGLLLDVNNIYVQSVNHDIDPYAYIDEINLTKVQEIHVAGHERRDFKNGYLLVDTHNQQVCADVWSLYQYVISKLGPCHTLIEWDADLPDFQVLLKEVSTAGTKIQEGLKHAA